MIRVRRDDYHLWLPELGSTRGGIQVYLAALLEALRRARPAARCCVLLKNDASAPAAMGEQVRFRGAGRLPGGWRSVGYALQLIAETLFGRPRLVIVGHLNFAPVAYWLHRLTGVPFWVLTYGIDAWGPQPPMVRRALHSAERVLTISEHTRVRLVDDSGVDPRRIGLLPPTFDEVAFTPGPRPAHLLRRFGLRPEQPVILTVSRLAPRERYKGYDQILAAIPRIRESLPDVHYLLVGTGDDRPRIESLVAERGLRDCVTLAGFVPQEELPEYYRLCDVFAMPSRREGFGIVFVEAMACGKPVLGGDRDGAVDALRRGELGALVDADDVPGIADALVSLVRRQHPNPLLYRPAELRRAAVSAFGAGAFRAALERHLDAFQGPEVPSAGELAAPAAVGA